MLQFFVILSILCGVTGEEAILLKIKRYITYRCILICILEILKDKKKIRN